MALPLLDLVFCCDCTGSMSTYIKAAQENITKIVEEITRSEKRDVRFALVAYKDHGASEEYTTKVFNFTESLREMRKYVDQMGAGGGGDGPEAVACALNDVLNLEYRKDATRICIFIADAPPHGLEPTGDSYPNGCPCGYDPVEVTKKMAEKYITVYTVGCEPGLGTFVYARDFMKAVADLTAGKHCALSGSHLLAKLIIAGAEEEIQLDKLMEQVVQETKAAGGSVDTGTEELSEDMALKISARLKEKGMVTHQVKVDEIVDEKGYVKASAIAKASKLSDVKKELDSFASEKRSLNVSAYKGSASVSSSKSSEAPAAEKKRSSSFLSRFKKSEKKEESKDSKESETKEDISVKEDLPVKEVEEQNVALEDDYISSEQVKRVVMKYKKK